MIALLLQRAYWLAPEAGTADAALVAEAASLAPAEAPDAAAPASDAAADAAAGADAAAASLEDPPTASSSDLLQAAIAITAMSEATKRYFFIFTSILLFSLGDQRKIAVLRSHSREFIL